MPWRELANEAANLPVRWVAWRQASILSGERVPRCGLASTSPGDQDAALAAFASAAEGARRLGISRVLVEPGTVAVSGEPGPTDLFDPAVGWTPDQAAAQYARRNVGRDRALDQLCRTLFEVLRRFDDLTVCLTPSRDVFSLGDVASLEAVFEDLKSPRLAYWHDAAMVARRCQLLAEEAGEWLQAFANRMPGITLGDCGDGIAYGPPGCGVVDHKLLGSYVRRSSGSSDVVLELDPGVDPAELGGAMAFLDKFGL